MISLIISQHKTMTTSTVQGSSSSSSSTVTRTIITSSTAFHRQSSSNHFRTAINTENNAVRETIERLDQLSIKQPTNKITSRKDDNFPLKKSDTVPSSIVPSPKVENNEKFQLDCLNAHNEYRRKHGVEPLKLNPTLSNFAQNWANVSLPSMDSSVTQNVNFSFTDNREKTTIAT